MLVAFEGLDRAGKSTQVGLLADHLAALGTAVLVLRYPQRQGTVTGPLIDAYLRGQAEMDPTAASLLLAANLYELRATVAAAQAAGTWVLFDRYAYSSTAYSVARGVPMAVGLQLAAGMPVPDATLFLGCAPEEGARRAGFGAERFERVDFQARVAQAYAAMPKPPGWAELDAQRPAAEVHARVLGRLGLASPPP